MVERWKARHSGRRRHYMSHVWPHAAEAIGVVTAGRFAAALPLPIQGRDEASLP